MKNHWKITLSVAVAAGYLLVGLATSKAHEPFSILNKSPDCKMSSFVILGDQQDTLFSNPLQEELAAGDTLQLYFRRFSKLKSMTFNCTCPNSPASAQAIDLSENTGAIFIAAMCE